MAISFSDIEDAFFFVSMDHQYMYNAYLCKETGETFYTSEAGDSDELPEDIDDPDRYVAIPHKSELDLGKTLVIEFTSTYLPEELNKVYSIFRQKVAYSRYKDLLESKGALEDWYKFKTNGRRWYLKNGAGETKG